MPAHLEIVSGLNLSRPGIPRLLLFKSEPIGPTASSPHA